MIDIVDKCTQRDCKLRQGIGSDAVRMVVKERLEIAATVKFNVWCDDATE